MCENYDAIRSERRNAMQEYRKHAVLKVLIFISIPTVPAELMNGRALLQCLGGLNAALRTDRIDRM
jgi:hypothetical protein